MAQSRPPDPIPADADKAALTTLRINEGDWRDDPDFACRACGTSASLHPNGNEIWGCKKCGYTTASVFAHFRRIRGTCDNCGHDLKDGSCPNCEMTQVFKG